MAQGRVTYQVKYTVFPPVVIFQGQRDQESGSLRLCRDTDDLASDRYRSVRAFQLVPDGQTPVARVVTEQALGPRASDRPGIYRVEDAHGAPLGRITLRRRLLRIGRTQWIIDPAVGPALHGYRGRLMWWALWWPVGLPLALLWGITSILGEGDGGFGPPRRVIWRDSSGRAHLVFRGLADDYQVLMPALDPRLVTALVGLHQSFDPSDGAGALGWYEA